MCCAPRSTWRHRTWSCATLSSTASNGRPTTGPAISGSSIPCTISPTVFPTRIERITHSICTLEFENNRPLYDWIVDQLIAERPAPADRVCPAQPELHNHQQAEAHRAGRRELRYGLGRPAHAHHGGYEKARLHTVRRSGPSARRSAWQRTRTSWTWPARTLRP